MDDKRAETLREIQEASKAMRAKAAKEAREKKKLGFVTVYRGYSFQSEVDRQNAEEHIRRDGDREPELHRYSAQRLPSLTHHDFTTKEVCARAMDEKSRDGTISRDERLSGDFSIFVTGDMTYASRYSSGGGMLTGMGDFPLIATLNLKKERLALDPVDFLYSLGYCYQRKKTQQRQEMRDQFKNQLVGAYGEKILDYLEEISLHYEKDGFDIHYVIDYMIMDTTLIQAHLNSTTLIYGKGSTQFKNSFQLIGGGKPEEFFRFDQLTQIPKRTYKAELDLRDL